ncbi:MAG: DUF1343 domain-containing protein [Myxococcota bacterium]|nr:DUF1343 domain-containing protein [Myxococcota bacterium]
MHLGLDIFLNNPTQYINSTTRVGLIANPTTLTSNYVHAADAFLSSSEINLTTLFGPEHGIRGAAQDMVTVDGNNDPQTGLPVISLYGPTFESLSPTSKDLENVDALVFDIQDVGARYYTYGATMALAMQKAGELGIRLLVLDRPNPIGGMKVEGGGLEPGLENFCALYPIPQRHGMTVGELANLYRDSFALDCELEIIPCEGWSREHYFEETLLPWVMPSPNMPTIDTAVVYPGMCLLEGTNLSEGRGTTKPFELFGAPFINGYHLAEKLTTLDLPGVVFRPVVFEPTFQKHAHKSCGGLQLHVTNREKFSSYETGLAVLWAAKTLYPESFQWRTETYEFRNDVPAIDLLTGIQQVREEIDRGGSFEVIYQLAQQGTNQYQRGREAALIYD